LHDIGKVVSQEVEGSHAIIGADLAKKYGEPEKVVNAIRAHHEDEEPMTVEAVLIAAADAISAAREGARHETVEAYVKRIEKLEEISLSFKEVTKAYALQAGREIRVIVDPGTTDDTVLAKLTKDIRQRIEKEMEFPGQIKIVVIRETRAVEYAK
jgi:ribonuclease Y